MKKAGGVGWCACACLCVRLQREGCTHVFFFFFLLTMAFTVIIKPQIKTGGKITP